MFSGLFDIFRKNSAVVNSPKAEDKKDNPKPRPSFFTVTEKDCYKPSVSQYKEYTTERVELSEKEAVAQGWSYRKKSRNKVKITRYRGTAAHVVIPFMIGDSVVNEIGDKAFFRNDTVKSVQIGSHVKKLGSHIFYQSNLESCVMNADVKELPPCTFFSCEKLCDVYLSPNIERIGDGAFCFCMSLKHISLFRRKGECCHNKYLGDGAFSCSGLESISIPENCSLWGGNGLRNTPLEAKYSVIFGRNDGGYILRLGGANKYIRLSKDMSGLFRFFENESLSRGILVIDISDTDKQIPFHINDFTEKKWIVGSNGGGELKYVNFMPANVYYKDGSPYRINENDSTEPVISPDGTETITIRWAVDDGFFYRDAVKSIASSAEKVFINITGMVKRLTLRTRALNVSNAREITVNGEIDGYAPLFNVYVFKKVNGRERPVLRDVNLRKITWTEKPMTVTKYLPLGLAGKKLIRSWVCGELMLSLTSVDVPMPRIYGRRRGQHSKYFFDRRVIDRLFTETDKEKKPVLRQHEKILIAIDMLRSTNRYADGDTRIYSDYLTSHIRYAFVFCRRIADEFPEYYDFLENNFKPYNIPLEIERKFLIRRTPKLKNHISESMDIRQSYLVSADPACQRRIRMIKRDNGSMQFFYTEKRFISPMVREENEMEIPERDYAFLCDETDDSLKPIIKTRQILEYKGQRFEIDVYPFDKELATMELELSSPDQEIGLPPFAEVIKEVTGDKNYSNARLALNGKFPE